VSDTPRLADLVEWDKRNWSAAPDFWQAHTQQDFSSCSALEVGSMNGGLSLWLALQGAHVVCSDIGPTAQKAIERHQASGVSHLIQYRSVDALEIPYKNEFDIVLFKSVLGSLGTIANKEGQARAIAQMHRALKKGGELFFAENLIASPFHRYFRRRFVEWGSRWRYVSVAEMKEFLSPFSDFQYRTLGFAGTFGRREIQRNILGLVDQTVLNHVVPESWRYIMVGVARK
jgi:SAM-dependent methyltransferase